MHIEFQSDVGKKRHTNQDYANVFTNLNGIKLAVLADGMGGHLAGDIASQMAVTDLGKAWESQQLTNYEKTAQWFIQALQQENMKIHDKGMQEKTHNGMGTTVVAAALLENHFTVANVGDSRAYLIRNDELQQITEDHSLVNELVKSGEISKEMAANHPRKNILTRSIGMPGSVEVDVVTHAWEAGDQLLLCSDGLTNMISEETILAIIKHSRTMADAVNQLIHQANAAGGVDNITVLLIQYKEDHSL